MSVISFDRDLTVETGRGPVPLTVVRQFLDHPDWRTYAHGNQRLVEEVNGITGMEEVRMSTEQVRESGSFMRNASGGLRENRLHAIRKLEEGTERLVCVDDIDLNHLNQWEYYFPSDFLEAYPRSFMSEDSWGDP